MGTLRLSVPQAVACARRLDPRGAVTARGTGAGGALAGGGPPRRRRAVSNERQRRRYTGRHAGARLPGRLERLARVPRRGDDVASRILAQGGAALSILLRAVRAADRLAHPVLHLERQRQPLCAAARFG